MLVSISMVSQKIKTLKPLKSISISIPEPSDICYHAKSNTFYIVSDTGKLYETTFDGIIIRKLKQKDTDFEAVYCDENFVYAVDETNRAIYKYNINTLALEKVFNVPYNGGHNKGFESIAFNSNTNKFILVTEKDPIILFELDSNFNITKQVNLNTIAKDISSANYYNNFLWLLSDESMMLMKLNPNTYEVIEQWSIPVINPEGFAFDTNNNLLITSDDMQRIYYFINPN